MIVVIEVMVMTVVVVMLVIVMVMVIVMVILVEVMEVTSEAGCDKGDGSDSMIIMTWGM